MISYTVSTFQYHSISSKMSVILWSRYGPYFLRFSGAGLTCTTAQWSHFGKSNSAERESQLGFRQLKIYQGFGKFKPVSLGLFFAMPQCILSISSSETPQFSVEFHGVSKHFFGVQGLGIGFGFSQTGGLEGRRGWDRIESNPADTYCLLTSMIIYDHYTPWN